MAISREKFKVYKNVFDSFTEKTLQKLSSQGHFEELKSPVFVGKESNVFTASKGRDTVIVKIYRLESCDFNRMFDYIRNDARYADLKNQRRKVIFAWAQREYRNLMIARENGVNVPTPSALLNHVLVLQMIGKNIPAQRLKDSIPRNPKQFWWAIQLYFARLFIYLKAFKELKKKQEYQDGWRETEIKSTKPLD